MATAQQTQEVTGTSSKQGSMRIQSRTCDQAFHLNLAVHTQAEGLTEASSQPERMSETTKQYAAACKEAAMAAGVPVLDLFSTIPDGSRDWKERFFSDGLHFTPAGQQRVYQLLVKSMGEHFPELR